MAWKLNSGSAARYALPSETDRLIHGEAGELRIMEQQLRTSDIGAGKAGGGQKWVEGIADLRGNKIDGVLVTQGRSTEVFGRQGVELLRNGRAGGPVADIAGFEQDGFGQSALDGEAPALHIGVRQSGIKDVQGTAEVGAQAAGTAQRLEVSAGDGLAKEAMNDRPLLTLALRAVDWEKPACRTEFTSAPWGR